MVHFKLAGKDLINLDLMSKSDPYLEVSNHNGDLIYTSETIYNDLNPTWKPFFVPLSRINHGVFSIKVWDRDHHKSDFIGCLTTTVAKLLSQKPGRQIALVVPKKGPEQVTRSQSAFSSFTHLNLTRSLSLHTHVKKKGRGNIVLESVKVVEEMCQLTDAKKCHRQSYTRDCSPERLRLDQFYTLESFQEKLRKSGSRKEYCAYIKSPSAQAFFKTHVPLAILPFDGPKLMFAEIQRQAVLVDGEMMDRHCRSATGKLLTQSKSFQIFIEPLQPLISKSMSKAAGEIPVGAITMWVCQSLGGNRIGSQAFNALNVMFGVDLAKDHRLLLVDVCEHKEAASLEFNPGVITVVRHNAMQLMCTRDEEDFEITFTVKTHSKLFLDTNTESFELYVMFNPDHEETVVGKESKISIFLGAAQDSIVMLSLHSAGVPHDVKRGEKLFKDAMAIVAQG